jgi:hypothetical protein
MSGWKSLLLYALAGYAGLVAVMYAAQRSLMYFPERLRTPPADAGFPEAAEVLLDTADGERIVAWHVAPRGDNPLVIYFQGNGGSLRYRVPRFRALTAGGFGLLAASYRGYSGSSGSPTEAGLIADARAAYDYAAARHPPARIALWGESLGSAVAVALAAERPVGRLVLEAPFTSAADVGAAAYPFLPVHLLIKDGFYTDRRIDKVEAPILVMHGDRDRVVPFAFGEKLYAMIRSQKRFLRLRDGGHENLDGHGALEAVKAFLAE